MDNEYTKGLQETVDEVPAIAELQDGNALICEVHQLFAKIQALERLGKGHGETFSNLTVNNGAIVMKSGQQLKMRDDQVENNTGGFVFAVSDITRVRRFLILGSSGGTFYASEKQLTLENLLALIEIINAGKSALILNEILDISLAGRNPKQEPIMLALALCARYRVHNCSAATERENESEAVKNYASYLGSTHQTAFAMVNQVCRIPTHLFMFVEFCEMYATRTPGQLAMHVTKYKKRNQWSQRDLFRLAHPVSMKHKKSSQDQILVVHQIYHFVAKGNLKTRKRRLADGEFVDMQIYQIYHKHSEAQLDTEENSSALNMIESILALKPDTFREDVVKAIKEHNLVREHIPTEHLNSARVWKALLDKMPMTAMIRNLGKMTSIQALDRKYVKKIVSELTDESKLRAARIHPLQILLAQTVYQAGRGVKGGLTWEPLPKIEAALEDAFYKSFANAPPTGKRFCLALDISGSMGEPVSDTMLSSEKPVDCVAFEEKLVVVPIDKDWNLKRFTDHVKNMDMGCTDCALPMLWAMKEKKEFDVFIVYTDNETYYGEVHPFEALRQYRESSGIPDAKLIVVGMTATEFSIADPSDAGMLEIVGFDAAIPSLIHDFVTGKL